MFLAYTPLEGIPAEDQYNLATDISLAALTGEGVFNFGEVVSDDGSCVYPGSFFSRGGGGRGAEGILMFGMC